MVIGFPEKNLYISDFGSNNREVRSIILVESGSGEGKHLRSTLHQQSIEKGYYGMKTDKKNEDRVIPIAPLDRLIRKANAERVSESAAKELGVILEELGKEIANRANDLAKHANRTTVKDSDIRLAYKQWSERM